MALTSTERLAVGPELFTDRTTKNLGLPALIMGNAIHPNNIVPRQALSEIGMTGIANNSENYRRLLEGVEPDPSAPYRDTLNKAALDSLMRVLNLEPNMSKKPGLVAEVLGGAGPTPEGLGRLLAADSDIRTALTLMFRLQGYEVANDVDERNGHRTRTDTVNKAKIAAAKLPSFQNFNALGKDGKLVLKPGHVDEYLRIIQESIKIPTGGVNYIHPDLGSVRVAYMIFTIFTGHGNQKYAEELGGKYSIDNGGDLVIQVNNKKRKSGLWGKEMEADIEPMLNKLKDGRGKSFDKILQSDGVRGLVAGLVDTRAIPADTFSKYWGDYQALLDGMDKLADIRGGFGGSSLMAPEERVRAVRGIQEFAVLMAKRKLTDDTVKKRLYSFKKISEAPAAAEPGFWEKEKMAWRIATRTGSDKSDSIKGKK